MQLSPIAPLAPFRASAAPALPMPTTPNWGTTPQHERVIIDRMNATETLGYVAELNKNGPRVWGSQSYDMATTYVVDTMRAAGWDVAVKELSTFGGRKLRNVVATRPGTAPEGQRKLVVAGAHLDSVRGAPGANDNASGSATLLSMARAFEGVPTANDLKFVWFDGEEAGLLGSRAYVKANAEDSARTIAMINMDMVGSPRGVAGGYDLGPHTSAAVRDAVKAVQLRTGLRGTFRDEPHSRSDHASFDNVGIPAIDFGVAPRTVNQEDPYYHSSKDTIDKLNPDVLEGYGDLIGTVVLDMANRPQRVAANRPSKSPDVVPDGPPI